MNTDNICPILLNNLPFLPYVSEIKHLGNTLHSSGSMSQDVSCKHTKFISKLHSLFTMLWLYICFIYFMISMAQISGIEI